MLMCENLSRKGQALSALRLAPELPIGPARAACTRSRGVAQVLFAKGIAKANDHDDSRYCESFATLTATDSQ
jgi:hypothetical protein